MCAASSPFFSIGGPESKAEPALLRAGLNDQLRRLSQAFDSGIRENCTALVPDAGQIQELGTAEALRRRYEPWASAHDPNLFSRVGMASVEKGDLKLYGINPAGTVARMEWPGGWNDLRRAMQARVNG